MLLTGATGFVGRFVLRDLLHMDGDLVVHCLVRATEGEHGLQQRRVDRPGRDAVDTDALAGESRGWSRC